MSILEAVNLSIKTGQSAEFESVFEQAEPLVQSIEGYLSHELQRCLEFEDQYLLLIRWKNLEAHTQDFRGSPQYQQWKALLHHFYAPFPEVYHFEKV